MTMGNDNDSVCVCGHKQSYHWRSSALYGSHAPCSVLIELGYFMGSLGRKRVCCLHKGELEIPSDFLGITYYPYQNKVEECYRGIMTDLKDAKYIS